MPVPLIVGAGVGLAVIGAISIAGALLEALTEDRRRSISYPVRRRLILQPVDHIRVKYHFGPVPYYHHGIVSSQDKVIHYDSGMDDNSVATAKIRKQRAAIRETSLTRFAGSAGTEGIELVGRPNCPQEVLKRARAALESELWSDGSYDLLSNNCEHFARWCVGERGYSKQVIDYSLAIGAAGVAAGTLIHHIGAGTIARIGIGLGLRALLPGFGLFLVGLSIVYAGYGLARGLGLFCNGNRVELDTDDVCRLSLKYNHKFI